MRTRRAGPGAGGSASRVLGFMSRGRRMTEGQPNRPRHPKTHQGSSFDPQLLSHYRFVNDTPSPSQRRFSSRGVDASRTPSLPRSCSFSRKCQCIPCPLPSRSYSFSRGVGTSHAHHCHGPASSPGDVVGRVGACSARDPQLRITWCGKLSCLHPAPLAAPLCSTPFGQPFQ